MRNRRIKNLVSFWVVVVLLGVLAGCSYTYYENIKCPSYVVCYVKMDSIKLRPESSDSQCILINHGNSLPIVTYGLRSTGDEKARYDYLCIKHNDLSYNQYQLLQCNPDDDSSAITYNDCDFTEIIVTANKDFDEAHPAGENLADIVRFMSWSPYRYILSGYSEYYNYNKSDVSEAFDAMMHLYINNKYLNPEFDGTCYPVDKLIKDLAAEDMILNGYNAPGLIGMLYFEKKPSAQGEYSITVKIKTDDGRVLSDTINMQF